MASLTAKVARTSVNSRSAIRTAFGTDVRAVRGGHHFWSAADTCKTYLVRQRILFIAVVAVLLVGAFFLGRDSSRQSSTPTTVATTSTSPRVPLLHEQFTLLACNQATTIGLEGCAEHQILHYDGLINHQREQLVATLRTTAARDEFINAEVNWTRYRSNFCSSEASADSGGTLYPVVYATCEVSSDQRHLTALHELASQFAQS